MRVIDLHGDALYKLQLAKRSKESRPLSFRTSPEVATNVIRLKKGNHLAQFFALFLEPHIPTDEKWGYVMEQIDLFHTEIIQKNPEMVHIKTWEDFDRLGPNQIGAALALEGADAFGNDVIKLKQLYREGILYMGLTWNHANLCADGAGEPRAGGLTLFGKEVVQLNNAQDIFTDVSHASEQGFWDILAHADYPIASHSNVRKLCDHPRNLYDDQIKAMFEKNGLIHVVFHPPFIRKGKKQARIADLIHHIDYLCGLGGVHQIGFGSDFDGITSVVDDLEHAGHYDHLINELLKHYKEAEVRGFAFQNFLNHRPTITPSSR